MPITDMEQKIRLITQGYWASSALHAGVRTGVAAFLSQEAASAEQVAKALKLDKRGVSALLTALCLLGFLLKSDDKYLLHPEAAAYLTPGGPHDLSNYILHQASLMGDWARLSESVTWGKPICVDFKNDPEQLAVFYHSLRDLARHQALGLAQRLGLQTGRRLLDLAGGPGTYGLTFAQEVPGLAVSVLDLPEAQEFFAEEQLNYPEAKDVRFLALDFTQPDDWQGPYDYIWLSHVLHMQGPTEIKALLNKAVNVLKPGGQLWLNDYWTMEPDGHPLAGLYGLHMLLHTERGRTYSLAEAINFLNEQGLQAEYLGPISEEASAATGLIQGIKAA